MKIKKTKMPRQAKKGNPGEPPIPRKKRAPNGSGKLKKPPKPKEEPNPFTGETFSKPKKEKKGKPKDTNPRQGISKPGQSSFADYLWRFK